MERVEYCQPKYYSNCNEWLRTTSGCEQRVVANCNEWLRTTSGCEQRVVAKCNEWLRTTSGCWHVWGRGFLKVGICIDDETWEKD